MITIVVVILLVTAMLAGTLGVVLLHINMYASIAAFAIMALVLFVLFHGNSEEDS